jgi:hypothetical protein
LLARRDKPCDGLADRHNVAFTRLHSGEHAIGSGFDLDYSFIGFNFKENFAFRNRVSFFL